MPQRADRKAEKAEKVFTRIFTYFTRLTLWMAKIADFDVAQCGEICKCKPNIKNPNIYETYSLVLLYYLMWSLIFCNIIV